MLMLDSILEYLPGSKLGRQILAETAESKLAKRRELCARIVELEAELPTGQADLKKKAHAARVAFEKAEAACKKAERESIQAQNALRNFPDHLERRIAEVEKELQSSAPAAIRKFDDQLRKLHDATLAPIPSKSEGATGAFIDHGSGRVPVVIVRSNAAAMAVRAAAILLAREENQRLALQALTAEELAVAQAELLKSIPSADALTEVYPPGPRRIIVKKTDRNAQAFHETFAPV